MPRSRVIILNGVGSVGKSSTANAVQAIAHEPLMNVAMDTFLSMLPGKLFGTPDGLVFEKVQDDSGPCIAIRTGPVIERTLRGMRHAIAALADQGNDLIVDEVMLGSGEAAEYRRLLSDHDLKFVGLFAPLEVIEARERARGDRAIGLARGLYGRVHIGVTYDLEIETSATTPEENARRICEAFGL